MKSQYFIIVSSFFFMISCTHKEIGHSDFSDQHIGEPLKKSETFMLELDENSNYEIFSHQVVANGSFESLYVLNKQHQSIDIYNLDSPQMIDRIPLIVEGPFSISRPYGFYVHNSDSIYVFIQGSFKNTQLINSKGDLINSYTPSNLENFKFGLINHASVPSAPSYFLKNKIYFGMYGIFDTNDPSYFNEEVELYGYFDLASKTIEMNPESGYPYTYLGKSWNTYHSGFSRVLNQDFEWIVSWGGMDSVFRYNMDFKLIDKKSVKSPYTKEFTPPNKGAHLQFAIEQGDYRRIIYDPYRNCYYSFVRHARAFDPALDKDIYAFDRSKFSIIKLDASLKVVSETVFPGELYNLYCAFVTKKGLCLPKTNYWNKDLKEDSFEIDIYL